MRQVASILTVIALAYLAGYAAVRINHTQRWFDKNTEEIGSYTFFDSLSESDSLLYYTFYPMVMVDSRVFMRPFQRDKW